MLRRPEPYVDAVLNALIEGDVAVVPPVWRLEVVNALVVAERRKKLSRPDADEFLQRLQNFRIELDAEGLERTFDVTLDVARQYQRSAYDASYLELAMRRGLPLATRDESLRKAAVGMGLKIFEP